MMIYNDSYTHTHATYTHTHISVPIDQMRQYMTQLRQEMGLRLVDKVFGAENKPSKASVV